MKKKIDIFKQKTKEEELQEDYELSNYVLECVNRNLGLQATIKEVQGYGNFSNKNIQEYYNAYTKYLI